VTAQPSFTEAVERRRAALPPKTIGYASLAGVVLGMVLYASFGPNDVLTGLLAGAVFGGIGANLVIRGVLAAIEAWATRRLELAIVASGVVAVLVVWYLSR
jgi:hypothetical protein